MIISSNAPTIASNFNSSGLASSVHRHTVGRVCAREEWKGAPRSAAGDAVTPRRQQRAAALTSADAEVVGFVEANVDASHRCHSTRACAWRDNDGAAKLASSWRSASGRDRPAAHPLAQRARYAGTLFVWR